MDLQSLPDRCFGYVSLDVTGYSVTVDCSDNDANTRPLDSLGNVGNGNNYDPPNFDLDPLEKLSLRNLVWSILIARKECERPFD